MINILPIFIIFAWSTFCQYLDQLYFLKHLHFQYTFHFNLSLLLFTLTFTMSTILAFSIYFHDQHFANWRSTNCHRYGLVYLDQLYFLHFQYKFHFNLSSWHFVDPISQFWQIVDISCHVVAILLFLLNCWSWSIFYGKLSILADCWS